MKISIVITAYNVGEFIERAVRSALSQTYKNIEVIIVEDCSTDNTKDIINDLVQQDDRIKVIYHDKNMGAGWGRRNGISAVTGDYFITVDGDDWLEPDFIESLVERAKETNADVVSGGITINRKKGYWESTCYGDIISEGDDKLLRFWEEKIIFMNNKIIRKELHDKVPYCTRRFIEDTPTIVPMLWYANKVAYVGNTGYHYRMQEASLTHTASPFKCALYRSLCALDIIEFFKKNDPAMIEKLQISHMLNDQLKVLKKCCPTDEELNKYLLDWVELTKRVML